MRIMNTYESWGQTFKISRGEDDHFNLWIHQKDGSCKIQIQKEELKDLVSFIQNFIDEDIDGQDYY